MELFLSHATADAQLVKDIVVRLAPHGVSVYAAEHDHQAGRNVHAKIKDRIRACDLMVVLLTGASFSSIYVHQEVGFALSSGRLTIPLVTREAVRNGLGMLEGMEYIAMDSDDPSDALHSLTERVQAELARHRSQQQQLITVGLIMIALGVIIYSLGETPG